MLILLCTCPAKAQNISWLYWDVTNNTNRFSDFSNAQKPRFDAAGNVYQLVQFNGVMDVSDGERSLILDSGSNTATVIFKFSPDGELIWYQVFEYLSNSRTELAVSPNGSAMLVARVGGEADILYEGQPITLDPALDYTFFIWLNDDGDLINMEWREGFDGDFNLAQIEGLRLNDDLTFWLLTSTAIDLVADSPIRHRRSLATLYDSEAEPLVNNVFDPGPYEGVANDFIQIYDFLEVNNRLYIPAKGNGFYGLNDAGPESISHHGYLLRVNVDNSVSLEWAITDAADAMDDVLPHQDGSYSILTTSADGVLNTTIGDFDIGVKTENALVRFRDGALISVIDIPGNGSLIPVTNRDDWVAVHGTALPGTVYPDGHGNSLTIPDTGLPFYTWVALYNAAGQMEYFEYYEAETTARAIITGMSIDDTCTGFYLSGQANGAIDLDLGEGPARLAVNSVSSRFFLTKYENEAPQIELPAQINLCPDDERVFEMGVIDEYLSGLDIAVYAPDADFDPALVGIGGGGIKRSFDLENDAIPAEFTLGIRVTDACGEVQEREVAIRTVEVPNAPIISQSGDLVLCEGDTLRLTAEKFASVPLLWSDGSVGDTLTVFEGGSYWALQQPGVNCSSPNSDTLNVVMAVSPEIPEITADGSLVICPGSSVTLTASLTERLVWSTGESTESITVNEPGVYSVYQSSEFCGDSQASEVEVTWADVQNTPTIEVVGSTQVCEGEEVLLRSSAGANSRWSNGEVGEQISVTAGGIFSVNFFDGDCQGPVSEAVEITVAEPFTLDLVRDTTFCDFIEPLELVPLVNRQGLDFLWSDGSTGSSLMVNEPGEYWVEVSNGACVEIARVNVGEACVPQVIMPTAFSPNGDGENDQYGPVGQRAIDFQMIIYNQWGRVVFVSRDINEGWDGTIEGKEAPIGKYVYKVTYKGLINGQLLDYNERGQLNLLR